MKVLANEMPLPSSSDRVIEMPTIEAEREHHGLKVADLSKLSDGDRAMARWVYCLGRGNHDFDDEGVCVDCDAKRAT